MFPCCYDGPVGADVNIADVRPLGLMCVCVALCAAVAAEQEPVQPAPVLVPVRPIEPPAKPLPSEAASAGVTKFSFIAYGDTRSGGQPGVEGDGLVLQSAHSAVVDRMIAKIHDLEGSAFPVRFAMQTGDAVIRGVNGTMWNVSFTPIIERLTRDGGVPYFFAVGNHDVTGMAPGDPGRAMGIHNVLSAMSRLIPPEGSPRRLNGYPTYAFAYGNAFFIVLDSNIASDALQLGWITGQLEHLDRTRFPHVIAFFHHPVFTSGRHGGPTLEPQSAVLRDVYLPLFRKHHVRMTLTGHDHLLDHFVERYTDAGVAYRRDDVVSAGGGAPIYTYTGEPDLSAYLAANAAQKVRVGHLMKPGPTQADNPHHFVVIQVDGSRLSLEVVGVGPGAYTPYGGVARVDLSDPVPE
jgi:hypothetical protein